MIEGLFNHCPGIGPKRVALLKEKGFSSWEDCLHQRESLPFKGALKESFLRCVQESQEALAEDNIHWLVNSFKNEHHWVLLERYFDRAVFFDIETTGLSSYDNRVTVVAALEEDTLHTFTEGDNLDDFIEYADTRELLVSFNGNCFDIPFLERAFHIPGFTPPHIDLRWVAWHGGYSGGLKSIEKECGIRRPEDVQSIDGLEALNLYWQWYAGNNDAGNTLVRYCAADVIATREVARWILASYRGDRYTSTSDFSQVDTLKPVQSLKILE